MLEQLVAFCLRRPWLIVLVTLLLTAAGVYVTATRFAIDTDTNHLFSADIPWRQNEAALYKAFPQLEQTIVAVIDGDTPEKADDAASRLTAALQGKPLVLRAWRPDEHAYFRKTGLLFLPTDDVRKTTGSLITQQEILQPLAEDPTLRGLTGVLLGNMRQVGDSERGKQTLYKSLDQFSTAFEATLAGKPAKVDWNSLLSMGEPGSEPAPGAQTEKRRIVLIKPVIDFAALQPGADAIALVRETAQAQNIDPAHGVKMRLTGQVPLADDEYATISENFGLNITGTILVVTLILFAALRSPKLIVAVLATLLAGLALTSGLGILLIGRFNLISVAFAALFIGLGVDFGIQFATRYREERHRRDDLNDALLTATRNIGGSLTLAAVSLLAGFFCFLPTDFRGVSELGLIAGFGMIIAFLATLTFLPALIKLLRPGGEQALVETASLASIDHWIAHHRAIVLIATAAVVLGGAPYLMHLSFDSNPMNLRSRKVESVATFYDLAKDAKTSPNTIEALAPSLEAMRELAKKIEALPEVDHVVDVDTLLPRQQDEKLPLIENAARQLRGVLNPVVKPAPSDAQTIRTLALGSRQLLQGGGARAQLPPAVARFGAALNALAKASPETRAAAQHAAFDDFHRLTGELRGLLSATRVAPESLPQDLRSDWVSDGGLYRIEATPKGDSQDKQVMTRFAEALQSVSPTASGAPIVVDEAGKTVVRAFLLAGLYSFAAIFAILVFALKRATDVALTLGPLVLAGVMSLEAADMLGMSLNFANIIALPLMFAVGVAFHIYYVIAWRKGVSDMLASSLTRAIFFSALTTGTAFGSLVLSSHPGTASMGELLAISLFFTLLAAFVIVPAFLGPPRKDERTIARERLRSTSGAPA